MKLDENFRVENAAIVEAMKADTMFLHCQLELVAGPETESRGGGGRQEACARVVRAAPRSRRLSQRSLPAPP